MTYSMVHLGAIAVGSINDGIRLFLISICLGACFIRAFWEIEQARAYRRQQRIIERRKKSQPG